MCPEHLSPPHPFYSKTPCTAADDNEAASPAATAPDTNEKSPNVRLDPLAGADVDGTAAVPASVPMSASVPNLVPVAFVTPPPVSTGNDALPVAPVAGFPDTDPVYGAGLVKAAQVAVARHSDQYERSADGLYSPCVMMG
ncbi:hypothetical protein CGRA01v4_08733 [Colletotrichum graminicola]|nr:hypothetical protein CGRA01v4_08733 [Colletotrichum graminicola]